MIGDPINVAADQLKDSGLASLHELSGCSDEEIEGIERQFSISLPAVYRRFLKRMGRSTGKFLQGSDFLFPELLLLREQAERLLRGMKGQFTLSNHDFVFLVHQGYEFLFFDALASDDPPVWFYLEQETRPKRLFDRFSLWLLAAVADEVRAFHTGGKQR
jgi:SMI1 / KNR4 family (SUKH-1)